MFKLALKQLNFHRIRFLKNSFKTISYKDPRKQLIKTNFNENYFEIKFNNFSFKKYPYIWLRDCCNCKECFDSQNHQHLIDLTKIPDDIRPIHISDVNSENSEIEITWSDGHHSSYNLHNISDKAFDLKTNIVTPIFWNKEIIKEYTQNLCYDYNDYLNDNETLKSVLKSLATYGIAVIKNAIPSIENCKKAIDRIAFVQKTIYGEVAIIAQKIEYADNAYSNMALAAHNDGTYMKNSPGLQIFQILQEAKVGGDTLLVDGFYCATLLKQLYLDDFEFLTKVSSRAVHKDSDKYDLCHEEPVIKLNTITNSLLQIRFNLYDRSIFNYLTFEHTVRYYQAIKRLANIIKDEKNEFWIKLKKDQILLIDNFRVLHGRSSFSGDRALLTAYAPRDEFISKARLMNII